MATNDRGPNDREPTDELENLGEPSRKDLESLSDVNDTAALERSDTRGVRREINAQEEEDLGLRDIADELEVIGPDDLDPDVKMENLEEYGFDLMDQDELLSVPSATPTPGWELEPSLDEPRTEEELRSMANDSEGFRPVEDDVIAELDDDLPPDREGPEL